MNIVDAYRAAWNDAASQSKAPSVDLLLARLEEVTDRGTAVGTPDQWSDAVDLYLELWQDRVHPEELGKALRKRRRRLVWSAILGLIPLVRELRAGSTPRWMLEPNDVELFVAELSVADVVDAVLPEKRKHWNIQLLDRARRDLRPDGRDLLIPVWLVPADAPDQFDVMVGKSRLTVALLPEGTWATVRQFEDHFDALSGTLQIAVNPSKKRADLQVWVPKRR